MRKSLINFGVLLLALAFILPSQGVPEPDAAHPYPGLHARGGPPVYITIFQGAGTLICLSGSIAALIIGYRLKKKIPPKRG